jgi:hypothetical protein
VLKLLRREDDVSILPDVESPDELASLHDALADGAIELLMDPASAHLVDQVERRSERPSGGAELDGDRHQAEADHRVAERP